MEYIIPIVILGLIGLWGISIYNKLVYNRNVVMEGWSGIETQLKRRSNLIPNLVEAVKGYVGHEKGVLENVTEARSRTGTAKTPGERGKMEGMLGQALANVFAVAEAYPELKANENFMKLHDELSSVEDEIQMARRYYNGTVRNLNVLIESFPSNVIAGSFGFVQAEYFEIEDEGDRAVPEVSFS
ncbi:MAG: LemA family protein [Alphaproteobacteria bacterium]|nr:LemA family protein [Alphaproteobacteria bacterium]